MKDRRDYRYVARRARRYDENYLTRNFAGKAPFIIRYQTSGTSDFRDYLWVEDIAGTGKTAVVLESIAVGGRTRHHEGSAIYSACQAAINRLLKEEDEQGVVFTAADYDEPPKKVELPKEFIKR
jgi:hypothetical protein